jgi:plastocyanin
MISRFTPRLSRLAVAAALCLGPMLATPVARAAQTVKVSAGAEAPNGDIQLLEFAPVNIAINAGDTVTWSLDSTEFHDVVFTGGGKPPDFVEPGPDGVFINPLAALPQGGSTYDGGGLAGSGLLNKGETYSLTFPNPGTYTYYCAIHAGMVGSIQVGASGQAADTQAAIDARRAAQINEDIATRGVPTIMTNLGELPTEGATVGVVAGAQVGQIDVQRFFPPRVVVHPGDAVTWIWKTQDTPHTVTFLNGQPAPEVVLPQPQANGPPRLQLNPTVLAPGGDPTDFGGGTFLNSGFLQPMPGQATPTFTVHFTAPGTYDYVCVLHEGMTGTVVVQ